MDDLNNLRVVLTHDWLTGMRGGEKVLEVFCRQWPDARLFTLLHRTGSVSNAIERLRPNTSVLQCLPGVHQYYRYLLPLMPLVANWRIPECDLVLSSSHCVAKGAQAPAGVPHVCYCFTPMRYAWHMKDAYFAEKGVKGWLIDWIMRQMREWDRKTSEGVSHFIAISKTVQQRIYECYDRESVVIYPPVDTDFYTPSDEDREDYYLLFSAFAPYKRLDVAIEACNHLKKRLIVIGTGQEERKLRSIAGPTIEFLGWQSNEVVRNHMRRCRALLFPGEEDFGIVPVEAMACGTPIIAYDRGGATDTVNPANRPHLGAPTGMWFEEQDADCLADCLLDFEKDSDAFDPHALRKHALAFSYPRFENQIMQYIRTVLSNKRRRLAA